MVSEIKQARFSQGLILGLLILLWLSPICLIKESFAQEFEEFDSLSDVELIDLYIESQQNRLRDSQVDQSNLVSPGRTLVQLGYTYTTQRERSGLRYSTHTLPDLLIRHSILPRLELRGGWGGTTIDRLSDGPSGVVDVENHLLNPSLGLRFRLWQQNGVLPQSSVTTSTPVDLDGNTGFLSRLTPQIACGYSWTLGSQWLLAGSTGAVWTRGYTLAGDENRYLDLQQSLSLDWLVNDRWSLYGQWIALFPEGNRIADIGHSLGPGVSAPLGRRMQVDCSLAFGIDRDSPDVAMQLFLSHRF
jgi:hypothetical protein